MMTFNVPKKHYKLFSEYLVKAQLSFIKVSEKLEEDLLYVIEVFGSNKELDRANEFLNLIYNY